MIYNPLSRIFMPVPVAARSKAWVCGRSLAGIAGSNFTQDMDVWLLWLLCVCQSFLRRADHSYRGFIPLLVCLHVVAKRRPRPEVGSKRYRETHLKSIFAVCRLLPGIFFNWLLNRVYARNYVHMQHCKTLFWCMYHANYNTRLKLSNSVGMVYVFRCVYV